ncbi:SPOR domain-containing protein [Litoreibacter roseus]|uniref:Sporulation protein n=1 Tax=Litoreibacter roseus TaxID=2601869 RepID=A0A6N6JE95_9RHOB|nr:SPOR domain-containing protein [Litoreibacter roseus]GFE63608.1 sporulation protein [Litoreibacter roseus]
MANVEFDTRVASDGDTTGLLARMMNWVGAASSVALIAGLGVWGYQLTVRDVSGVPVIQALEGPARVQPNEPGGELAQNQGLAVNALQSEQATTDDTIPAPQVVLAPAPLDLEAEDRVVTAPALDVAAPAERIVPQPAVLSAINTDDAVAEALGLTRPNAQLASLSTSARVDPSIPGVRKSLRPALRPKVDMARIAQQAGYSPAPVTDLDPAAIPTGTRLVQLGAYDTRAEAEAEWDRVGMQFTDYLTGKSRVIQEARSGGGSFFRLRAAGFDDLDASRRFCTVLEAEGARCIPVSAK